MLLRVCLYAAGRAVHKRFSHLAWKKEAKAFENERQSDAGGGDRANGNLDSPVVYL